MESDTEIIVVPLRQMLLFEKLFAQNYADMLVRFGSIIETCNKINGYWESDGWTEIYEDMADKSDRMNEIVDDMTNYYKDIVNITESYDVVEAINVDIGESLSGDVIN